MTVNSVTAESLRRCQLFLQGLNIALIHYSTEIGGVQVEILPILGDRIAGSISSCLNTPSHLLEQAATFLPKQCLGCLICPAGGIAIGTEAEVYH